MLDAAAGKSNQRIFRGIEEISRPQVSVPLGDVGINAGDLDFKFNPAGIFIFGILTTPKLGAKVLVLVHNLHL